MIDVVVVYHSGFGHTEVQARHVMRGAADVPDVSARMLRAQDLKNNLDELDQAHAIVFGSPTYMGSVSAPFKEFMDASSKVWADFRWKNKVAGAFTNSYSMSGDKLSTLLQLAVFAMQHGMIWVGSAEMNGSPAGAAGKPDAINRMGSFMGAMAQSDNASPEETPPSGDLLTAAALGRRIAEITKRLQA